MLSKMDESIASTISSLNEAFKRLDDKRRSTGDIYSIHDLPSIFTDEKVLARPPFAYIHALAEFFVQQKEPTLLSGWRDLLFGSGATSREEDANNQFEAMQHQCLSRKEKLTFLMRLLAIVSKVTDKRLDILVSPSKILCGQDVLLTHELIRALASCTMNVSEEVLANAVKYVMDEGDATLYKRGVRSRRAFTHMQAIVRGWIVRRKYAIKLSVIDVDTTISKEVVIEDECGIEFDGSTNDEADSAGGGRRLVPKRSKVKSKSVSSDEKALLESYQTMLSRKSEVDNQLKVAESKLRRENDKLIRMLNLGTAHKTRTSVAPYANVPRPPMSAPSSGMPSDIAVAHNRLPRLDETFRDTITNFSERQRTMKQKERRIEERESKLKQRFARSKQKEAELKLQEERISDLAAKIRKQQMQLKEQRLEFERSQLLKPDSPPETTRPCVLCTEKKMQMRKIRTKIRQRTRALSEREALVIERAHELRRRESQIVKREKIMAELEQQSTVADELLDEYSYDEQQRPCHPHPHEKRREKYRNNQRQRREDEQDQDTAAATQSLPSVSRCGSISNRPRSREARKRRRERSPPETSAAMSTPIDEVNPADSASPEETNPVDYEANVERNSMRTTLGEVIPTIIEESPADEHDEDQSSADESDNDTSTMSSADDTVDAIVKQSAGIVSSNEDEVPADINKVRQQLGISKSKMILSTDGPAVPRRSTIKRKKQANDATAQPRRISQPPPPKERHVFAFERRDTQNKMSHNRRLHSSESTRSTGSSSLMPDIDGDLSGRRVRRTTKTNSVVQHTARRKKQAKPLSTRDKQHDDWISSFDVQIKKIMTELEQQSTVVDGLNSQTLLTENS